MDAAEQWLIGQAAGKVINELIDFALYKKGIKERPLTEPGANAFFNALITRLDEDRLSNLRGGIVTLHLSVFSVEKKQEYLSQAFKDFLGIAVGLPQQGKTGIYP